MAKPNIKKREKGRRLMQFKRNNKMKNLCNIKLKINRENLMITRTS